MEVKIEKITKEDTEAVMEFLKSTFFKVSTSVLDILTFFNH